MVDLSHSMPLLSNWTNHASVIAKADVRWHRDMTRRNAKVLLCSHFVSVLTVVLQINWIN